MKDILWNKCVNMLGKTLPETNINCRQDGAMTALYILSGFTVLNFIDQCILSAVKVLVQEDLNLTDAESSYPTTAMGIVSLIFALILGWVCDKGYYDRRHMMFGCIFVWSCATTFAGFSKSLGELIFWRSCVGLGVGAYNVIAPVMIADFFPVIERNLAYGIVALSIPIGGALSFSLGSVIGSLYGWRSAFFAMGIPGIFLSFLMYICNDPIRGINDRGMLQNKKESKETKGKLQATSSSLVSEELYTIDTDEEIGEKDKITSYDGAKNTKDTKNGKKGNADNYKPVAFVEIHEEEPESNVHRQSSGDAGLAYSVGASMPLEGIHSEWKDFKEILYNLPFEISVGGLTLCNFALAGLSDWLPAFLYRYCDVSLSEAGFAVGAAIVLGGISGNLLGAQTAQYFEPKVKSAYYLIPAVYTIPASFFFFLIINATDNIGATYMFIFLSQVFVWTCVAPIGAVTVNVIRPELRSYAAGIAHVIVSVLGNVISPPIIGGISDSSGSLLYAMQLIWITTILSGLIWYIGYLCLPPLKTRAEAEGVDPTIPQKEMTFKEFFNYTPNNNIIKDGDANNLSTMLRFQLKGNVVGMEATKNPMLNDDIDVAVMQDEEADDTNNMRNNVLIGGQAFSPLHQGDR